MSEKLNLSGRTVLITGAARGIGEGVALRVAAKGARPALVGIEPELMEAVAARIRSEHGVDVFVAEADVRDRAAVDRAVSGTVEALGGIDVVVANAGIEVAGSISAIAPEDFQRVIDVNLMGVFHTLQATLPHVLARNGHLLPIASAAAVSHAPAMGPYAASKAAVDALANVMRQELAGTGTSVGCGYFTFLDTDMVRNGFERPVAQAVRGRMPGPIAKIYPLSGALDAIVSGIENRNRVVAYPGWVKGLIATHGFTQPLVEKLVGDKAAAAIRSAETQPPP
jgi:NAD(P)-dependent dehydrogenase (short-subunit alcohol dehydrogenase family)